jgi:hypothetical protein
MLDAFDETNSDVALEAEAGDAGCDGSICDATCVDMSTDPSNCGRCGHDCQGGACAGGACQPAVLGVVDSPYALAINSTGIFISSGNSGTIESRPIDGGIAPRARCHEHTIWTE